MMRKFNQIAILGSGVMGSQIAAVFANARLAVYLFDQADLAQKNLHKLPQLKPSALVVKERLSLITPCCYETDLAQLKQCDLIIEAVVEDLAIKQALFAEIEPFLNKAVIVASNTSSLSIATLAKGFSHHQRFCGIHFFNPVRYLSLVELVLPGKQTDFATDLEYFLSAELGKNILYVYDTAGFIANRIGVFSLASCLYHAQRFGLDFDTVDALTGKRLKRAKSATFRTADLVGLDILVKVFNEFYNKHNQDAWRHYFLVPDWLVQLVENGQLGQKTKAGIYQKQGAQIEVYNPQTKLYQQANYHIDPTVEKILNNTPAQQQLQALKNCTQPQAQFLYAILKDLCLYASFHLQSIANTPLDIDLALRWGYGWQLGIFAYWQQNGIQTTLASFLEDTSPTLVAGWLSNCQTFYQADAIYHPKTQKFSTLFDADLYRKQLHRTQLLNPFYEVQSQAIIVNEVLHYYHEDDGIGIVRFKTKMNTLSCALVQSLQAVITHAEANFDALLIYQDGTSFCAGANLYEIYAGAKIGRFKHRSLMSSIKSTLWQKIKPNLPKISHLPPIDEVIKLLQQTLEKLKFCRIPTIAVVEGLALGGGCELLLHCDRRVVAQESYIGLVEIGVGLLPAGGGCKEMALRAHKNTPADDLLPLISQYFKQIGLAQVSGSAQEAYTMGYLDDRDLIVSSPLELLYHAKQLAKLMVENHYRPPQKTPIRLAGSGIYGSLLTELSNMKIGKHISEHDYHIASLIAKTLTGGQVGENQLVDSDYLLNLEREHFLSLLKTDKTQARIEYMLTKNKALRN